MDRQALISGFRVMSGDHSVPPLWSDEAITGWLNEAERRAARAARLLFDRDTPAFCQITLLPDVRQYRLHPKVYDVEHIALERPGSNGQRKAVKRADSADVQWSLDNRPNLSGWADCFDLSGDSDGADTRGMVLRLDRKPAETGGVLHLNVYRYPRFDMEQDGDEPEIALRHHEHLIDWALHRAYLIRDIEGSASPRAERHKKMFTDYFGELQDVNVLRKQQRHRPPVVRPLKW